MKKRNRLFFFFAGLVLVLLILNYIAFAFVQKDIGKSKIELLAEKYDGSQYAYKKELITISFEDYSICFYYTEQDKVAAAIYSRCDNDEEIYLCNSGVLAIEDINTDIFPVIAKGLNTTGKSFVWGCMKEGVFDKVLVDKSDTVLIAVEGVSLWFTVIDNTDLEKTVYFYRGDQLISEVQYE